MSYDCGSMIRKHFVTYINYIRLDSSYTFCMHVYMHVNIHTYVCKYHRVLYHIHSKLYLILTLYTCMYNIHKILLGIHMYAEMPCSVS